MKVVLTLELACENADDLESHPKCDGVLLRRVGGQPEKADPLVIAMGRGHLIGEAKAKGWKYIQAGSSPTLEEINFCPKCWAERNPAAAGKGGSL